MIEISDYPMRDTLGGVPYERKIENEKTVFRFFPKTQSAKNPNSIVFVLSLDESEKNKFLSLLKEEK